MPPKPKFTKEEIAAAALSIVSEKGMQALTARELGLRLGSSARPIFTVFRSMEEVQQQTRVAAMARFNAYAEKATRYTPAFKQFGMQMILFAQEEPKLFQLLFMTERGQAKRFEDIFSELGEMACVCMDVIMADYGLCRQDAKQLFQHVWVHTFGIGALCATGACSFSQEELNELLGQDFQAMMLLIQSGRLNERTVRPSEQAPAPEAPACAAERSRAAAETDPLPGAFPARPDTEQEGAVHGL